MAIIHDKERFVFYVSVGEMPPTKASAHLQTVRNDFLQAQMDRNHGVLPEDEEWYFVAVRGDSRIERL